MIYAPMMPDRLAREAGLGELGPVTDQLQRQALLLLADWNEIWRGDIYAQCGFVGDTIAIASMYRWQPDLRLLPLRKFIVDTREAVEFHKATRKVPA